MLYRKHNHRNRLVDALRQWPRDGTPRNPGAWLTAVGKRKAIDLFRRDRTLRTKYARLGRELELGSSVAGAIDNAVDLDHDHERIDDDTRSVGNDAQTRSHPLSALMRRISPQRLVRLNNAVTAAVVGWPNTPSMGPE